MITFLRSHFLALLFLFLSFGTLLFWAFFNALYIKNNALYTFSWIVNSDWMMHLSQVQNFSALPFWYVATHHPLYSGDILSYPFFVNWFSGVLLWATDHLVFAMVFPMMIAAVIFIISLYYLFFLLGSNRAIAVMAFFLFFLSGGWQWIDVLQTWTWTEWKSLPDYVFDYDHMVALGYHWKSVFLTTLLPQRAYIWGISVGALGIALFIQYFIPLLAVVYPKKYGIYHVGSSVYERFFFIGVLLGTLSFIHTHSFLWIILFFIGVLLWYIRFLYVFIAMGVGAFFTALPFGLLLLEKQNGISEISLFPLEKMGMHSESSFILSFVSFWFTNWGLLFCLLCLVALPAVWRYVFADIEVYRKKLLLAIFTTALGLWILFSAVQMQSNPWDNTKVWLWSSLFFSFFIAAFFYRLWTTQWWGKVIVSILFFFSIFSGILMLHSGLNDTPIEVFSKEDREMASVASSLIPPNSIVLSDDYFHLPFTALVPKQSFMGYRGWISSYGMNTDEKLEIMQKIFSGSSEALSVIQKHNIDFILIDNSAKTNFTVSEDFFRTHFPISFPLGHWGTLYKTQSL